MYFPAIFFASLAIISDVRGHGSPVRLPKLLMGRKAGPDASAGRRDLGSGLQPLSRRGQYNHQKLPEREVTTSIQRRQDTNQCGAQFGSCAQGECCSQSGFCGTTTDYCKAPNCQIDFGSGCDALQKPAVASTAEVPRPKLGDIPYGGAGIYSCSNPGTAALTFDDGPSTFTDGMLDLLKAYNAKATFFINANNNGKGQIQENWRPVIEKMMADGHQVASHSYAHMDLSKITQQQRIDQMVFNEMSINDIIGMIPTYMRPPFSSCDEACQTDMADLGYHIVYFDVDTDDTVHPDPAEAQLLRDYFTGNLSTHNPQNDDVLIIGHDIVEQTADMLLEFMLKELQAGGWKMVTVGDCLKDPVENWYRGMDGNAAGKKSATKGTPASDNKSPSTSSSSSSAGSSGAVPNSSAEAVEASNNTLQTTGNSGAEVLRARISDIGSLVSLVVGMCAPIILFT